MPLLKKISELKVLFPRLLSTLSTTALLPNVDKAQRKYINKVVGRALLASLQTKYDLDMAVPAPDPLNLTAKETELIKNIQLPLGAFAMMDDLAFIQSNITDNGIRTPGTEALPAAHKWEYLGIKNNLQDYAIDGVELLLDYLYDNKADFPQWTDSDEYKEIDSFLIKTGTDFTKYYPLYAPFYTYWFLKPVMADVEENYLASTFGRDLLTWIKTQDSIEITAEGGLVDVKRLLKKAVAFLTIKHACDHATVKFGTSGFTVLAGGNPDDDSNAGMSAAESNYVLQKQHVADRDGQNYLLKVRAYLVGIANGQFDESFGDDFTNAFESSPLFDDGTKEPWTNGNEKRGIFRF